ncbi:MAG: hypothetical protein V4592_08085 [Bacteroidota bacterium]
MKILYRIFFFSLAFSASAAILCGCRYDQDKDGLDDEQDACVKVAGPSKNQGCPIPPEVQRIHLFLDNSASMAGYYGPATDYKAIVTDLAVKMDREIKAVDITLIADETQPFRGSATDLSNAFATTKFSTQRGSELHKMLTAVAKRAGKREVALLVTDGILSFPDSAILRDREINVNNAKSTLKNDIYAAFSDLRHAGYAASLYAFQSKFSGTYYTYQNGHVPLKGEMRPFYLWVIGQQRLLPGFDARLEAISSFHPAAVMHFGLTNAALHDYQLLPQVSKLGHWAKADGGIGDVEIIAGQPLQAALGIDLGSLPPYARNLSYLRSHIETTCEGCTVTATVVTHAMADSSKLKTSKQLLAFSRSSHVLLLRVTAMGLPEASIKLVLPMRYDNWFQAWSTMDDRDIKSHAAQTFALEHLVQGVLDAYDTRSKNFIEFNLKLRK